MDRWKNLSEREKTFLKIVFDGDEAKATDYAQVAGINANSLAGEPLSVWFYRLGNTDGGRARYREINVQRIVFERFKQNANPQNLTDTNLEYFCGHAPAPQDFRIESSGTPDQIKSLRGIQANARRPHIEAMAAGFDSLLHYGLRNRALITEILRGCILRSAAPVDDYYYDTVLARMVKAGADINVKNIGGERPIQFAVKNFNATLVERLVRDGAEVKFTIPIPICPQPGGTSNLYGYMFGAVRSRDTTNVLRIIRALSSAGLPPTDRVGYIDSGGYGRCHWNSFYEVVVDTGNLNFAKQIKEAAAAPSAITAPSKPAASAAPVAGAGETGAPEQIGAWRIKIENGRRVAVAKPANPQSDPIAALRLECVAGGRLEYVPVALKLNAMTSLWLNGADDNVNEMRLVNQRASGPSAATLSKEFLTSEANYTRNGQGNDWTIEMNVEGAFAPMAAVKMAGFGKMRSYMLANCKN